MKRVVIIDYGSGNLRSAAKAFEKAGTADITVSGSPSALETATHIVLPGVGAFADCMRGLSAIAGMRAAMERHVLERRTPFLGICVGMQLLFDSGHEHGEHKGLGWIAGEVVKIDPADKTLKIPHMGWNDLQIKNPSHPLLARIAPGAHAYFVHSYHARCDQRFVLAEVDYGMNITAVVAKENIMGTQFHPEKSQQTGQRVISNFLAMANQKTS